MVNRKWFDLLPAMVQLSLIHADAEIPMRATTAGYNLSHVLSDFVRNLDNTGRAVTSAYPGVTDAADKFFAPLEVLLFSMHQNRSLGQFSL